MADAPLVFVKKIELKLENTKDDAIKSIEHLLTTYRGAEIRFQDKNEGSITEFTIGSGANTTKTSIFIHPNSNNTSKMTLEVSSTNSASTDEEVSKTTKKIDILLEDILIHLMSELKIKEKAKILTKGKICPNCKISNDVNGKFCKDCGFDFVEMLLSSPKLPQTPSPKPSPFVSSKKVPSPAPTVEIIPEPEKKPPPTTVDGLDKKYPAKHECTFCDFKCAYKKDFIFLLSELKNLEEPFKKFDEFLRTKDLLAFSDYIYEYSIEQMKKYSQFSKNEIPAIAFCIFSILSWHILEKASEKIRLTFAKKMKERITVRFDKENPSISSAALIEPGGGAPLPTIKTGSLRIEENRCPYCYRKFDERILKLKMKGYICECPNCGTLL